MKTSPPSRLLLFLASVVSAHVLLLSPPAHAVPPPDPSLVGARITFANGETMTLRGRDRFRPIALLPGETATIAPQNEKPPPELERLANTIGVWDTITTYRFAPEMPKFESRSVETVRWAANHQFLITEQAGLMPDGWINALAIITWIPKDRKYQVINLYLTGEVIQLTMEMEGSIRKIISYVPFEGRLIRSELTAEDVSGSESKFRCEYTDEGKTWLFSEGISKKRVRGER